MEITQRFTSDQTIRPLSSTELTFAKNLFTHNIGFLPHEKVLIVSDPAMLHQEAALWFETAKALKLPVELLVVEGMTHSGEEPPLEIIEKAEQTHINFFQTSYSLTHTQAGKKAILNQGRGLSLPGAYYSLLMKMLQCDYGEIKTLGEKIIKILRKSSELEITSAIGTHLTTKIRQTGLYNDAGFFPPGELGNFPGGEVFFAPLPGSTNGTLVIDGSIADDILDKPITVTIVDGSATKFTGGTAAKNLEKKLRAFGKAGLVVAEVGIGTNPAAQIVPNLLEAEKAYGTVHIAFGNSSAIGGENNVPIHIDGLLKTPTVFADIQLILENNTFQF